MNAAALLPVAAVGAGVAGAASASAVVTLLAERRKPKPAPADEVYEDADGKSTPEAMAAFSNRYAKACVLATSAASTGTAIAFAVLTTSRDVPRQWLIETWLLTASLSALLVHAICIVVVRSSIKSYNLGALAFVASLPAMAASLTQVLLQYDEIARKDDPVFVLRVVNLAMLALFAVAVGSLPRRPDVFLGGKIVDRHFTVSLWQRFTWTWPKPILDVATKKGDLASEDIPCPDHTLRVQSLMERWNAHHFSGKLVWNIFNAARGWFALVWTLTLVRCVLALGPFLVLRRLLQKLERRLPGEAPDAELWALILMLALLTLLGSWMDGFLVFCGITRLALPCRAQLSALVFEKSLRRKAVKFVEKKDDKEPEAKDTVETAAAPSTNMVEALTDAEQIPETTPLVDGAASPQDDRNARASDTDSLKKSTDGKPSNDVKDAREGSKDEGFQTQQTVVNLLAVDTNRVYSFLFFQHYILSSLFSLFIYSGFLIFLIGWLPFAAGILFWGLVIPVNTYCSKLYMANTEKLMKLRDEKLAVVNEALLGMRQIKFAALEKQWEARVGAVRDRELAMLWRVFMADVCLISCWIISPIGLAAASLATYVFMYGNLVPSVAFVAIGVFKSLELTLGALPEFFENLFESLVSANRIDKYLQGPELESILTEGAVVAFQKASVAWPVDIEVPNDRRYILSDIDLAFPVGELSVISGKTGTGKSLLLSAILGEVDLLEGSIFVPSAPSAEDRHDDTAHPGNWILPGAIAYVGQTPWLEGASLRDNILFGLPHIESRYQEVLKVCALKKDLEILTDGDRTELGANGINLSGGQKWRVTLARAIYSRASILVMDDIFSAVDAHVGRQIFDECIGGELCRGRTRILVTHHVSLVLSRTAYLVELGNGTVLEAGPVDQVDENALQRLKSREPEETTEIETPAEGEASPENQPEAPNDQAATSTEAGKAFIEEETREKGMVKTKVYSTYFTESGSWIAWVLFLILFLASETGALGQTWWLRIWTGRNEERSASITTTHTIRPDFQSGLQQPWNLLGHSVRNTTELTAYSQSQSAEVKFYLGIYIAIALATGLIGVAKFVWMAFISMKASRSLFTKVLAVVLRTPLRWVDTVPIGRILNRMTSDFEKVDQRICMMFGYFMGHVLGLIGVCVAAALVTAYVLPLAGLLLFIAFFIARKYLDGARPIKRLESTSKSPVLELFNASLAGLTTLRAFKNSGSYIERMYRLQDWYDITTAYTWFFNRWMGWRMAILGAFFSALVAALVVADTRIGAALAGFTLTFALEFSGNLIFSIRMYSNLELNMNSTERIVEYTLLKTEDQGGKTPPASWPSSGRIEVEDLSVAYAENLPPVLKGVSFSVKDNERIGIVGRTGAGKSSLTLALFRFLDPRGGTVHIDGLDVSKMDLHSLRSRLAIIPQDPTLFSGTIRDNLDPFSDRTDQELHDALANVHLVDGTETPRGTATPMAAISSSNATLVSTPASSAASTAARPENVNIFRDLSSPVAESGGNLSQGQRQLLCLARAIVSRPKIMVLDEATSAVDMATDTLIQRSIREGFSDSTLLVIAHRLTTIADFDRILVLSEGRVAEFDTPRNLWETEGSIFRDMCEKSGEREKLRSIVFGSGAS